MKGWLKLHKKRFRGNRWSVWRNKITCLLKITAIPREWYITQPWKGNPAICDNDDESGDYHVKWNKHDTKKNKYCIISFVCGILKNKKPNSEKQSRMVDSSQSVGWMKEWRTWGYVQQVQGCSYVGWIGLEI